MALHSWIHHLCWVILLVAAFHLLLTNFLLTSSHISTDISSHPEHDDFFRMNLIIVQRVTKRSSVPTTKSFNAKSVPTLVEPRGVCRDDDVVLVVFVQAEDAGSSGRRTIIRETWGDTAEYGHRASLFFVMGKADVESENRSFGDILQGDYGDTAVEQSSEALFALRWITKRCPKAKYIMRTDESQFINLFTIVHHLSTLSETHSPTHNIIMCAVRVGQEVDIRKQMNVPGELYSEAVFPDYCSGRFYILSQGMAVSLIDATLSVPYFAIEDIYISGLLIEYLQMKHVDINETCVPHGASLKVFTNPSEWWKYSMGSHDDEQMKQQVWGQMKSLARHYTIPVLRNLKPGKLAEEYVPNKLLV